MDGADIPQPERSGGEMGMSSILSQLSNGLLAQQQQMQAPTGGILGKIAGGLNRFGDELLMPTTGLGKLGAYLSAAAGNPLGEASLAAMKDQREQGDTALDRQYKQAQIDHLLNPKPANNDTANDYEFYKNRFGPDFADNWLKNQAEKPQAVQSVDPGTGEVKTYFVRPSMLGAMAGQAQQLAAPTAPVGKLTLIPEGGAGSNPRPFR